jgi:hypothetical protein
MTYTEEELEALADAAGVRWRGIMNTHYIPPTNRWLVGLNDCAGYSHGETKQEAMNHYWNRYINGEVKPYMVTPE